jgi:hypothetical protein
VADDTPALHDAGTAHGEHGAHGDIHLPPPSFAPINVALALTTTLIGFVDQIRNTVGGLVWGIGVVWLVASLAVWIRAARNEFNELPESIDGH